MKGRTKKNFKFFLFILVLCVLAFGGAMLLKDDNNSLSDLLENLGGKSIKDNYNGIYTYADELDGSKSLFKGCILSKINNHIVIINDNYYIYRSSCIGTFLLEEGKTNKLDIGVNEEKNNYYIKYNNKIFYKDYAVTSLEMGNKFKSNDGKMIVKEYKLLFKESQRPGEYFNVPLKRIDGVSSNISIEINHIEGESFTINLVNGDYKKIYSYTFKDFDSMPELYPYGAYLVVIEKDETDTKYNNNLKVIGLDGVIYNLEDKFPIVVDDVVLNRDIRSVYVFFDKKEMDFKVIISNDKKLCYENGKEDEISYYEFVIDYNYSTKAFEKPEFVKRGFKSDSCVYINEIIGG